MGDQRRNFQARFSASGVPDAAYDATIGFNAPVRALLFQQSNGRVFVGGTFSAFINNSARLPAPRVARLNTDGTFDTTFNPNGTGFNGEVRTLSPAPDGNLLVGGTFSTFNGSTANKIAKLNGSTGALDTTFATNLGSGADDSVEVVALQPADGKILVGGAFSNFNGSPRRGLVRLNQDGTLDTTFNPGTGFDGRVLVISVQSDGQIVVGGEFSAFNGSPRRGLVRLNGDQSGLAPGSIDANFNAANNAAAGTVRALVTAGTNQFYIGGEVSNGSTANGFLTRINADGSPDPAFVPNVPLNGPVRAIVTDTTGRLLVGGDFSYASDPDPNAPGRLTFFSLVRFNADGTLDTSYTLPAGGVGFRAVEVDALSLSSNGKVFAGGNFTALSAVGRLGVDRLNGDGSADPNFNTSLGLDFNVTRAVSAQAVSPAVTGADDQVFVGGDFLNPTAINNPARRLVRLLANGSLDISSALSTGGATTGIDGPVRALATQTVANSSTSVLTEYRLAGGDFTTAFGVSRPGVARFAAADGSVDAGFNAGLGTGSSVRALAVQSNNAAIIGGDFLRANATTRLFLARVNANGAADPTFNPGTGPNGSVEALAINATDGKIYVGGTFTAFNGQTSNRGALVRLNTDGTLDGTFTAALSAGAVVRAVVVQPDGRVVIGGDFASVGNVSRNNLARLNVDGSLDVNFDNVGVNNGTNGSVRALALRSNGRILVGGAFSTVNGVSRTRLAQLNGDQAPGTFAFSDPVYTVSQTSTVATITVVRQGGTAGAATVNFSTVDGTAKAGVDYVATGGTLTFPDGTTDQTPAATAQTFTVTLLSPPNPTANRAFGIVLSSPTGDTVLGTPSTSTVNIVAAAPGSFTFASDSTSVREDAGSATFAVTRANGSAGQVTLTYMTMDGNNSRGRYTPTSGTLIFGDGDTAPKLIRIPVLNDNLRDGDASVVLTLLPPTGSPVVPGGSATATLNIVDDEGLPATLPTTFQFAAGTFTAFETDGTATITVTRAGGPAAPFSASGGQVTVQYFVTDLTGRLGANYANTFTSPNSGTLMWGANDFTPKTFTVSLLRDGRATGDLQVGVALADPQPLLDANNNVVIPASLGTPNQATLTIIDADLPSVLQFSQDVFQTFEDGGAAVVNVSRTGGSGGAVAVAYSVGGGSAGAGVRYAPTSGTLAWAAGDLTPKSIVVPILQDSAIEPDQTALLSLGQTQGNAVLGPQSTATLLITDDDGGQFFPVLSVDSAAAPVATTDGVTKGLFFITRRDRLGDLPNLDLPLTVSYSARGTARNGTEYRFLSGVATIPAGQDSVRVKVKAINGGGDRMSTVKLILNPAANYFVNPDAARAKVKIVLPATAP